MDRKGFTLVELAIVLVIIGVILGGVIKGQELVNNAKLQKVYREYQQVEFATFSYYDRYNNYPGDRHGDKDGLIEDDQATSGTTGTNEDDAFWFEVRKEGFYSDGETDESFPKHGLDGQIIVTSNVLPNGTTATDILKNSACLSDLTRAQAESLDAKFDDGDPDDGKVRAGTQAAAGVPAVPAAALTDYSSETIIYITCIGMDY